MVSKRVPFLSLSTILLLTGLALGAILTPPPFPSEMPSDGTTQFQVAPLNPDFIAWRARKQAGEITVLAENAPGGLIPSPFDDRYLRDAGSATIQAAALPSKYDLRDYGWVTPAKDQGTCGACFAFATYSSLESWLLKNSGLTWDFSENHLKNYSGFDMPACKGGDPLTSTAYLVRGDGPVLEADDPFHAWDDRPSPGGVPRKYVTSVLWFYSQEDIKNAIMNYGALFAPMYWDYAYYNASTKTYYYTGTKEGNHAVGLIGWDDSKSVAGTSKKGAWIVKSSYGTALGEQGCFYISYENQIDKWFAVAYCDAVPTSSYLPNHQYDELGFTGLPVGAGDSTLWGANVFTVSADEDLAAVGFYALAQTNTAYEITVYDTITRYGSLAYFSEQLASVSGTAPHFGYYTITLPSRVHLRGGDDFAIVVKFTTPGTQHPLAVEAPIEEYSSKAKANAQEGYVSTDGESFTDITTIATLQGYAQTSICIKGLTVAASGGGGQGIPSDLVEVTGASYALLAGLASGSPAAQASQKQAVEQLKLPLEVKTKQTGILFRLIPPGTFTMGSPLSEAGRYSNETQHQVTLTKAFYCSKFEITQAQWQQVMESNPSYFKSAALNAPVEQVSWDDCQSFLTKLCQQEGVPMGTYRLLTEAEWEYACRAGTPTPFCYGNSLDWTMASFDYHTTTVSVGSFRPNAWGLYDMHGNVWEWCQDWYGNYPSEGLTDWLGPASGVGRVIRGGCWHSPAGACRSADHNWTTPDDRGYSVGLRLARTAPSYP
jgi:formylglycine-generating enzyme required for sulfatase activity/C1A family cysteine protease